MTTISTRAWPTAIADPNGLTEDEILAICPAVGAMSPHESRSAQFVAYPTLDVLSALRDLRFVPTAAMQGGSRIEGKHLYTRHLVRVRQIDDLGNVLEDAPEIIIINGADGTAAYIVRLGYYRMVCQNGQISGDEYATIRVPHRGNVIEAVVAATRTLSQRSEEIVSTINRMKGVRLDLDEQRFLAECAMLVRFGAETEAHENGGDTPRIVDSTLAMTNDVPRAMTVFQPQDFLNRRRDEDRNNQADTVMNVIQENLLRGGIERDVPYIDDFGRQRTRTHKTKPIKSVAATVNVDMAVWALTKKMMELKGCPV